MWRIISGLNSFILFRWKCVEDNRSDIKFDPIRADDPEYNMGLVGQFAKVSLETVRIVKALPDK